MVPDRVERSPDGSPVRLHLEFYQQKCCGPSAPVSEEDQVLPPELEAAGVTGMMWEVRTNWYIPLSLSL